MLLPAGSFEMNLHLDESRSQPAPAVAVAFDLMTGVPFTNISAGSIHLEGSFPVY